MRILWTLLSALFLTFGGAAQNVRWVQPGGTPRYAAAAGNYLVTANGNTGLIHVWDRNTLQFLKTLPGNAYPIWSLDISRDGTTAVASGDSLATAAWNISGGTVDQILFNRFTVSAYQSASNRVFNFTYPGAYVYDIPTHATIGRYEYQPASGFLFSPDGATLALPHAQGATIRDIATGDEREVHPELPGLHPVAYTPDGLALAIDLHQSDSDTNLNSITFWNIQTGAISKTLVGADGSLAMAFNEDQSHLATLTSAGDLVIWDLSRDRVARTLTGPFTTPLLFISPERLMVSGRVLDLTTGQLTSLTTGSPMPYGLQFSPSGRFIATPSHIFETETGRIHTTLKPNQPETTSAKTATTFSALSLSGIHRWNIPIAFLASESQVAVGNTIFDVSTGQALGELPATNALAFASDWYLASQYRDDTNSIAQLRRYLDGSPLRLLHETNRFGARAAAVSPSENLIATAVTSDDSLDRRIKIWNATTGEFIRNVEEPLTHPYELRFSPNERFLAAISEANDISYGAWDLQTGERIFHGPSQYAVLAGAIAFLGSDLLLWGHEGINVRDLRAGADIATLTNELHLVNNLAVSPDGKRIAATRVDGTVLLLDAPTFERLTLKTQAAIPTLTFPTRVGLTYTVESSPDLQTWTRVTQITGNGFNYERPMDASTTTFYRLR